MTILQDNWWTFYRRWIWANGWSELVGLGCTALPWRPIRRWVRATAIGAGAAWTLGMIPSTVAALSESSGASGPPPFEGPLVYVAAAGMGLTLGVILGLPQWLQLRSYARRSLQWVGANAVAWAAGMVIIFAGAGSTPANAPVGLVITIIAAAGLSAGLVVGAIHGLILIRILKPATETMSSLPQAIPN